MQKYSYMDYYLGEMYVERLSVYMILISIDLARNLKLVSNLPYTQGRKKWIKNMQES